ncbi:MAG: PAS domain-containing protein [Deltaproteobacteria bacterium]|nr:PAS domain-containing protein [Deltaproteobacteria bacterium]
MPDSIPTSPSQLIKEAEARLRLALDCVGDGSWDWNIETGEVFYSDRWIESLRYNRSEVPPYISFWKSLVHPDDEERSRDALSEHLERRTDSLEVEYRLKMGTGDYRWTLDRGRVLNRDDEGDPVRIAGTSFDITKRKLVEQQQQQTELRYRAIVEVCDRGPQPEFQDSRVESGSRGDIRLEVR